MLRSALNSQCGVLVRLGLRINAPSSAAAFSTPAIPQPITSPDVHYTGVSLSLMSYGVLLLY